MLDKREGSIWLFKRISLFQKESIFLKKIRQTPQLFVNSICRNGKRLVLKSILKQISYESVFFNAPNRIWMQALVIVPKVIDLFSLKKALTWKAMLLTFPAKITALSCRKVEFASGRLKILWSINLSILTRSQRNICKKLGSNSKGIWK